MHLFTLPGATFQRIEWFREELEAWILWYQCELVVKLIFDIYSFEVSEQPVQYVLNKTPEQLMQFIRLVKLVDIAERVLPELVADRVDT